jgi:amino-acid N-acetyltransferase
MSPQALTIDSTKQLTEILEHLTTCELPTTDVTSSNSILFFGLHADDKLVGLVGLEVYGSVALLRSLAVAPGKRKHGMGKSLVEFAEAYAAKHGIESLYLLTTTAKVFFSKLGYSNASRETAPSPIKTTSQFSSLCPSSSAFMGKRLR